MASGRVIGVSVDDQHRFSKVPVPSVELVAGLGVRGDAHAGGTVQHLSRKAKDPDQPNLRQVHLLHEEFLQSARDDGFDVTQGDLGENVLTAGIDILSLPAGTRIRLGPDAVIRVTGLRNPCVQIDRFRPGLLAAAVTRGQDGAIIRRSGVMSVVEEGGVVRPGDELVVELPDPPHVPLDVV